MKILILGGYGVFGGRLAELLAHIPDLDLLIAGRNLDRATQFCDAFQGAATVTPVKLDRRALDQHIHTLAPDLVVDASGPFQDYGEARYSVIETCIRSKVDYMDFADAADFVFGVSTYDTAAKDAGVFVLSGVSSFPVLTAAVLREMAKTMHITSVRGGIAPSPYAGIGLNVMRAVVGYAGAPVKLTRGGMQTAVPGLTESLRYTVAVPGHMPLNNIHFSLVDVPDLQVIPPEHPGLQDIWMGAGPVPEILHRVLNLLAKARATFKLPSLEPLAPLFYKVLNLMKFGEHRGGMFVHATGRQGDTPVQRAWHLLAEGDDGPYIPSMAIAALVEKLLSHERPEPGARPATQALSLKDYDQQFQGRSIYTGFRDGPNASTPLYRQILGDAFDALPPQLQALHDQSCARSWEGSARVQRGSGMIARLVAKLFRFPAANDDVPVKVHFNPNPDGSETWRRTFGGHSFSPRQSLGRAKNEHLLVERFGPVTFALALVVRDHRLFLVARRWSVLGLPLPRFLLPNGVSFEEQTNGHFRFDVEISGPIVGLIAAYQGELKPSRAQ